MGRFGAAICAIAGILHFHDAVITILPKPIDDALLRLLYFSEKVNANDGVHLPQVTFPGPRPLEAGEDLSAAFDPRGFPRLIKNVVSRDQDALLETLVERNSGRTMRTLDYSAYSVPHFSSSCSAKLSEQIVSFATYARHHLFSNVASNSSSLYAGFEAITDPEAVAEVTGVNITALGDLDYRLNQIFTSNFAEGTALRQRLRTRVL